MFLVDRPAAPFGLRADLAPRQLFGGGDLVRAALPARLSAVDPAPPSAQRQASRLGLASPRSRKVG